LCFFFLISGLLGFHEDLDSKGLTSFSFINLTRSHRIECPCVARCAEEKIQSECLLRGLCAKHYSRPLVDIHPLILTTI
jgi:hypothetical protein